MIPVPGVPLPIVSTDGLGDGVAESLVGAILGFLIDEFVGGAVSEVTDGLIAAMTATSTVDLNGDFAGLGDVRVVVLALSASTMLAVLFAGVIRAVVTGQPGALVQQAFYEIPRQGLLTAVYLTVAQTLIVVVDQITAAMMSEVSDGIGRVGGAVIVTAGSGPGTGFLALIFMIIYLLAAVFVWAELLVRSALIYVIAVLAPLGYAVGASPSGRDLARRTTSILAAVIVAKLGIGLAFRVGAGLVNGEGEGGDWSAADAMVGATTMGLAAFMPFMILKAIPIMESAAVAEGAERAPMRAAATALGTAVGLGFAATNIARLAGGQSAATGRTGGPGPPSPPSARGGGGGGGPAPGGGGPPALGWSVVSAGPANQPDPPRGLAPGPATAALPRGPIVASRVPVALPATSGGLVEVLNFEAGDDGTYRLTQPDLAQHHSGSRMIPRGVSVEGPGGMSRPPNPPPPPIDPRRAQAPPLSLGAQRDLTGEGRP